VRDWFVLHFSQGDVQGISALCDGQGDKWTSYVRSHFPSKFSQLEEVVRPAPESTQVGGGIFGTGGFNDGNSLTPLHWAALGGHAASIVKLMSLGFDANMLDAFGQTPAHTASRDGNLQAIKTLVYYGSDIAIAGTVVFSMEGRYDKDSSTLKKLTAK
jgi:hypothetical protein